MWSRIKEKLFNEKPKTIIVGLGNPGEKYTETTHNSGFRVLKSFQEKLEFPEFKKDKSLSSLLSKKEDTVLLLPLTFMNLSGNAVTKAVKRYNTPLDKMIVVHDDNDLDIGTIRFSFSSGSGGHRGVQSIITSLKSNNFYRLRIGVRKSEEKAKSIVLKKAPQELKTVEEKAVEKLINKDFSTRTIRV